LQETNNQTNK